MSTSTTCGFPDYVRLAMALGEVQGIAVYAGIVAMGEWAARCDARHQSGYGPRDPSKPECNLHNDCADYDRVILEISGRIALHCYKPGCRACG